MKIGSDSMQKRCRARAGSIEYREEHGSKLLPLQGEGGPAPVKRAGTEGVILAASSGAALMEGVMAVEITNNGPDIGRTILCLVIESRLHNLLFTSGNPYFIRFFFPLAYTA